MPEKVFRKFQFESNKDMFPDDGANYTEDNFPYKTPEEYVNSFDFDSMGDAFDFYLKKYGY